MRGRERGGERMRGRGDKQLHKQFQYFEYKQYQTGNKL